MIWQNPWAWLGLLALAVPVVIHLLGRRSARVQRFPTLRFLDASVLQATRRTRLSDRLLLAVRIAILAAAVAALAQPYLLTTGRTRDAGRALARGIIVDTSASMLRTTDGGERGIDVARREAQRQARESTTSVILESVAPAHALAGAVAWLETQPGRHEVTVVSDFQAGVLDSLDLAVIPSYAGVRLVRIDAASGAQPLERVTRVGGVETVARITIAEDRTDVEWAFRQASETAGHGLLILAGPSERAGADAAVQAALTIAVAPGDTAQPIAIVFPHYERRELLMSEAQPLNRSWMGDVFLRLGRDSTVEHVAHGVVDGRDRLLLFTKAEAGSLASASLIAAALNASSSAAPVTELEPNTIPSEMLRRWERAPGSVVAPRDGDAGSDGRWLWLLALVLLGAETWLRRPRSPKAQEPKSPVSVEGEAHERVA